MIMFNTFSKGTINVTNKPHWNAYSSLFKGEVLCKIHFWALHHVIMSFPHQKRTWSDAVSLSCMFEQFLKRGRPPFQLVTWCWKMWITVALFHKLKCLLLAATEPIQEQNGSNSGCTHTEYLHQPLQQPA